VQGTNTSTPAAAPGKAAGTVPSSAPGLASGKGGRSRRLLW
jgi:hypothetical protein